MLLATPTTETVPVRMPYPRPDPFPASPAFRWEADMTAPLVSELKRLLPRPGLAHLVVGEIPCAQGIADVLAVRLNPEAVASRLRNGVGPICSPLRIRTLDHLRVDRPLLLSTLARRLGTNPRALIRSTLADLEALGLVDLSATAVRSTGSYRPVGLHVTAVELKLSKWRDALRQADNLCLSADRSWVVVDEATAKGALDGVELFKQFGVGLAVLKCGGRLRVVVCPAGRRPERWLRALVAERAWAAAEAEVAEIARSALNQCTPAV